MQRWDVSTSGVPSACVFFECVCVRVCVRVCARMHRRPQAFARPFDSTYLHLLLHLLREGPPLAKCVGERGHVVVLPRDACACLFCVCVCVCMMVIVRSIDCVDFFCFS